MSKNKIGKEQLWQLLFLVTPIAFVLPVANILEPNGGITSVLISGALGMFGAVIGMLLFKLGENKTNWFKGGLLAVFFSLMVLVLLGIKEYSRPVFNTCEVCGYYAIKESGTECEYCVSDTWDIVKSDGDYSSKEEWLFEEQMFLFYDSDTNEVDFYGPDPDEGFVKDTSWKPVISKRDIYEIGLED